MKSAIHPKYFTETQVVCSCGNTFVTGSTKEAIHVEVCYKCHPLYTGEKRYLDTLGTVERFQERQKNAVSWRERTAQKKQAQKTQTRAKTLRELMTEM